MSVLIGYNFWATEAFQDDSPSLTNIKYTEFSAAILDEISFKKDTNDKIDQKLYKVDNLEAGTLEGLVSE